MRDEPEAAGESQLICRRLFLRRSAFTAAALWLGGLGFPALHAKTPTPKLDVLTPDEFATLHQIAIRILDDAVDRKGVEPVASLVARRIDRELRFWDEAERRKVRQLLGLFEHWTLVLGGMWGPFTAMLPAEQDRYLARWMNSSVDLERQGFMFFKQAIAFFHYTLDATWPRIGYDGTWIKSPPMPVD